MFYEYKCNVCDRAEERQLSPNSDIPERIECECGGEMLRVFGGHQINMNYRIAAIQAYNRLPEHAKEKDTSFLKNESMR